MGLDIFDGYAKNFNSIFEKKNIFRRFFLMEKEPLKNNPMAIESPHLQELDETHEEFFDSQGWYEPW